MLKIQHLTYHYPGTQKGVTDLSLEVKAGDLYAFIGHNGAGKTTTLKAVAGIHGYETGEIYIDELLQADHSTECKRRMAYIPDAPELFPYLTGIQYLNFIADIYCIDGEERSRSVAEYAGALEITGALGDLISSYSHGMKQKLAIVSAMIRRPRLLILDEPFVGLDPKAAKTLKDMMRELCASGGAVFFSTHVLEVAEKLCNRVAIIKDGRLQFDGDMQELIGKRGSLESAFLEVGDDA